MSSWLISLVCVPWLIHMCYIMHVCMYVCLYLYVCVFCHIQCMYVLWRTQILSRTHTHTHRGVESQHLNNDARPAVETRLNKLIHELKVLVPCQPWLWCVCATWFMHILCIYEMTNSYVGHLDKLIHKLKALIPSTGTAVCTCDMTHSHCVHMWHDSFTRFAYATWLIYMWDV